MKTSYDYVCVGGHPRSIRFVGVANVRPISRSGHIECVIAVFLPLSHALLAVFLPLAYAMLAVFLPLSYALSAVFLPLAFAMLC